MPPSIPIQQPKMDFVLHISLNTRWWLDPDVDGPHGALRPLRVVPAKQGICRTLAKRP